MGLRSFLVLHRRMGLISALFVLVLSTTGLVLHYSNSLGLDRSYIDSPALLGWYGIELPSPDVAYRANGSTVVQIEQSLYLDHIPLAGDYAPLTGMTATPFGYLVATVGELLLITPGGELIEELGAQHGVPLPVDAVATDAEGVWLRSGAEVYSADLERLEFMRSERSDLDWIRPVAVPVELAANLSQQYASSLLSWERLVLDLHSGQLFGAVGRVLMDIMALLFILMAVTGIWIWSKRRP